MTREVLLSGTPDDRILCVIEDGEWVEFYRENHNASGGIYVGTIMRNMPDLHAAFVDIGQDKAAFLGEDDVPNIDFKGGRRILVQIKRPAQGTKGARVTANLALSGQKLVYMPHGRGVSVSQRLPDNERKRLRAIGEGLNTDGGILFRTAADGAAEIHFTQELTSLRDVWRDIQARFEGGAQAGLLFSESLIQRTMRELVGAQSLIVEGADLHAQYPHAVLYDREIPLFVSRGINLDALNQRRTWLKCGGNIVRDKVEAMTVFDVNSGKSSGDALTVNLEAAEAIVRQLRLNDIGGMIVIDFIDGLQAPVEEALRTALDSDRARGAVYGFTAMGLFELSRKRIQ